MQHRTNKTGVGAFKLPKYCCVLSRHCIYWVWAMRDSLKFCISPKKRHHIKLTYCLLLKFTDRFNLMYGYGLNIKVEDFTNVDVSMLFFFCFFFFWLNLWINMEKQSWLCSVFFTGIMIDSVPRICCFTSLWSLFFYEQCSLLLYLRVPYPHDS